MQPSTQPAADAHLHTAALPATPSAKAPPVWFITGCSTGFGLELTKQAIAKGFRTVVTARNPACLLSLEAHENVLVLRLDVTQPFCVAAAVSAAERRFGQIDVLVNNAGIGYFSAIEEGEPEAVRDMFDVNVFGMCAMVQAVLPGMRSRRQGCIVNVSSLAGLRASPALGYYNATKFAVEGLSEALWQEAEPLGIKVMVVEPSGFRTDWAGRSAHESEQQIDDYTNTAGAVRLQLRAESGKQPGDPARAAQAILAAVQSGQPPHHLLLGAAAFEGALAKLDALRQDIVAAEAVARSADFPLPQQAALPASKPLPAPAVQPTVQAAAKPRALPARKPAPLRTARPPRELASLSM
jgi:NAD(P)-dependent dehydrogenase (short-subunit alcohol dehydrogenase family)